MWEPCILAVLYTTGCMVLPLFFPCTPTECQEIQVRGGGAHFVGSGGERGEKEPADKVKGEGDTGL